MDIHTAPQRNNRLDYMDEMDPKNGKLTDDRLDSGVDSLKEDVYQQIVQEMADLDLPRDAQDSLHTYQAWKHEVTEDGDT